MYRNLCLVCGKATLGEEFCSPQHEDKYMSEIRPANAIPKLEDTEQMYRSVLLDAIFSDSQPARIEAAIKLIEYGLTTVGRKDRIYNLAAIVRGEA